MPSTPTFTTAAERAQPGQQRSVAGRGGRELAIAEHAADLVDHRGVVGLAVGVHAARDVSLPGCHAGLPSFRSHRSGRHAPAGAGGQDSDGASRTGSYQVTNAQAGDVQERAPGQPTNPTEGQQASVSR